MIVLLDMVWPANHQKVRQMRTDLFNAYYKQCGGCLVQFLLTTEKDYQQSITVTISLNP